MITTVFGVPADSWEALGTWATFGLLAVSVFVARNQLKEVKDQRREQIRPFVVVAFDVTSTLIDLVIENTGPVAARDVKFRFDPPLASTQSDPWPPRDSTFLTEGIPMMVPGKRYAFFFDSFPQRFGAGLRLKYEVEVTYKTPDQKRSFRDPYVLDLTFLLDMPKIERKGLHEIGKSLDELTKEVHKWTDHMNGIRVYTVDRERHERVVMLQMAFSGVARNREGKSPEEIRAELVSALLGLGERYEPPDEWVEAIVAGERFHFDIDEMDAATRGVPPGESR